MRILFLTSTFHPKIGGAETYGLNITRGLAALGHTIEIVTDSVTTESASTVCGPNVTLRRLYRYRETFDAPDRVRWEEMAFGLRPELAEIAHSFKPDVVISNSLDLCVLAKLISLEIGARWVATFHEQAPERDPLGDATLRVSYGILQPDAVIAGSQFYLERAHRFAPRNRCHLIYHGIDTDMFRPLNTSQEVRERYGIASTKAVVVSLGRFKARKGFVHLIRAFAALLRSGRSLTLVIAGSLNSASEAYFTEMSTLAGNLDVAEHIRFENSITHERVPWLLSGSDIVVQASLEEGLGLSVIEAMSCERPVVATRIPGHTEIIHDDNHAVLVEPGSANELVRALATLLDNSGRRRDLGEKARVHIIQHFSLGAMAAGTARLLGTIAADRASHARQ
ncbi:MAG: glycosyltransferase family 4 protein [Rhizobiales bacterium]|nr:glycosyltransferase family 4 protein [Hyphomicrobiales bacterium]